MCPTTTRHRKRPSVIGCSCRLWVPVRPLVNPGSSAPPSPAEVEAARAAEDIAVKADEADGYAEVANTAADEAVAYSCASTETQEAIVHAKMADFAAHEADYHAEMAAEMVALPQKLGGGNAILVTTAQQLISPAVARAAASAQAAVARAATSAQAAGAASARARAVPILPLAAIPRGIAMDVDEQDCSPPMAPSDDPLPDGAESHTDNEGLAPSSPLDVAVFPPSNVKTSTVGAPAAGSTDLPRPRDTQSASDLEIRTRLLSRIAAMTTFFSTEDAGDVANVHHILDELFDVVDLVARLDVEAVDAAAKAERLREVAEDAAANAERLRTEASEAAAHVNRLRTEADDTASTIGPLRVELQGAITTMALTAIYRRFCVNADDDTGSHDAAQVNADTDDDVGTNDHAATHHPTPVEADTNDHA